MRKNVLLLAFIFIVNVIIAQTNSFYFKSGFEGTSYINQYELNGSFNQNYADVYGSDNGYDWEVDLDDNPDMGNFRIYYEVGDISKAKASIVNDPLNNNNKVLEFKIDSSNVPNSGSLKGRIQASINGNNNLKEFFYKVKLYIHPDINILKNYDNKITWFTLMEFWNNVANKPFPFRITLNIQKPDTAVGSNLYFGTHGQVKDSLGVWNNVWKEIDTTYQVPMGEWLTFETHFLEGDSINGKYKVTVTDSLNTSHTLFDITNYTHHPNDTIPDGVKIFNPMKLYTFGKLIENMSLNNANLAVYWDDFELWTDTSTLSLNEYKFTHPKFFIYPNPFSNVINIKSDSEYKTIYIYNIFGVFIRKYEDSPNTIDLSDLSSGLYLIKIHFNNESEKVIKLLKK